MIERFAQMPMTLRAAARTERLGDVPALLAHPDWASGSRVPVVIWMHGRTAHKELDPGRYLRWLRAGIGTCAVDLPGHGERRDDDLQQGHRTFDVVKQMIDELDGVVDALEAMDVFDMDRIGIGGMSAGGMVTLSLLCRPHRFACACVEATSGSWRHQGSRAMFKDRPEDEIAQFDPIRNLDAWREIPLQAIHARHDEWINVEGQRAFIDALRARYAKPDSIEWVEYERTGAPHEHIGFGSMASDAKDRQRDFLRTHLLS